MHLDLARYHELGRFRTAEDGGDGYDRAAAWFHLEIGAKCGILEAVLAAARICLGLPHELLADLNVEQDEHYDELGVDYMQTAAELGDRGAMLFLADAYEKGQPLGTERCVCTYIPAPRSFFS